jgi:glucose/arabinose dehydrogenase
MGGHQDPRLPQPCANGTGSNPQAAALTSDEAKFCKRVDLASKVITPDVLVQPLEMTFYPHTGEFPKQYDGDAFTAEHGSWDRANRAGYEVI